MTARSVVVYRDRVTGPASARIAFETARLALARQVVAPDATLDQAYATAVRVSADALKCARVGIWRFDEGDDRLVCHCLFTAATGQATRGEILDARQFPTYVATLRERRAIAVKDALTHPTTRELAMPYLNVHGIVSLLDAPIIVDGRVVGVVCHEHATTPREFSQREVDFAGSVADMVALVELQAQRVALEIAVRGQEELVQRAAKLEAVGRLARSAAHDFNNVLSVVLMASEMLRQHQDPNVASQATSIQEAAHLGSRIAKDLLVLGRDEPGMPTRLSVTSMVTSLAGVLRTRFGARIDVSVETTQEGDVLADPSQIERIVLNLGVNAGEAITDRGHILLRVRAPLAEEASGRGWVAIEVSDDGVGMNHEVRSHLFEPYFTTKETGHGLGLASVYGIVRQLKGKVLVESEAGRGTTFVIILPTVA